MIPIHLHVHSDYSISDSLVRIPDLVQAALDAKMPAVALTDHNNLFGLVKFYQKAEKAGIKPIIGAQVFYPNEKDKQNPFGLILLCQNQEGYKNLTQLISKSYLERAPFEPQAWVQKAWFTKASCEGLIAISMSQEGEIAQAILSHQMELAESALGSWHTLFPQRFYCEITRCGRSSEAIYLQGLRMLSTKLDCAIVASNAVRFITPQDFEAHEARVCIQSGHTLVDPTRVKLYTEQQYFKNADEMRALFKDLPEALANTVEIAKRCNLSLKLNQVFLPQFPVPNGGAIDTFLIQEAMLGLRKRLGDACETRYQERLQFELDVINKMGFAGYFLIVADFIRWAKANQIPVGPGRGSGAGSLVAYVLEITDLDPLLYDLLFERFLNPERVSMPDFDIDFCMENRDRVIDYVAQTYGRDAVSQIITFGTMAAKAVVRDVGRVLGHPYGFVDKIAKLIPLELGITLARALQQDKTLFDRYEQEEEVKLLIDLALKLEGLTRNVGKHAGGVVIAPSRLTNYSPLYCDAEERSLVTQFDKNDVETIGLVKFDFLGLRTLTIIDWAVGIINARHQEHDKPPLDINKISLTDPKTFDLLRACETTAVFQLESRGMKDLIKRLQPDVFEDIIALVALFRPGPLQSGMVDDFINRKHGRAALEYPHPELETILKPTYGIILYQEQVMQIAQVLAGYTLGSADMLRRAMGKKKPEEMAKQRSIFTQGAEGRGVALQTATYIFDLMEKFAGYGFNKSHSAAYALVTYQTAWLKAHYPEAFMAAVLSSDMGNTDKVVLFIEDCRALKLRVMPPNVNESFYKFTVTPDGAILYGLGAIKGVGEHAIEALVTARSHGGPFEDLFDLTLRVEPKRLGRRTLEALLKAGALDTLGGERAQLQASIEDALLSAEQSLKDDLQGQADLFGKNYDMSDRVSTQTKVKAWTESDRLRFEKETLGLYLTGHPIDEYAQELKQFVSSSLRDLKPQPKKQQIIAGLILSQRLVQTKRGERMCIVLLDDKSARQEVLFYGETFQQYREQLQKDHLIVLKVEVTSSDFSRGLRIRVHELLDFKQLRISAIKHLCLSLKSDSLGEQTLEQLFICLQAKDAHTCPVRVFYQNDKASAWLSLGEMAWCHPSQDNIMQIRQILGAQNVRLCYSEH